MHCNICGKEISSDKTLCEECQKKHDEALINNQPLPSNKDSIKKQEEINDENLKLSVIDNDIKIDSKNEKTVDNDIPKDGDQNLIAQYLSNHPIIIVLLLHCFFVLLMFIGSPDGVSPYGGIGGFYLYFALGILFMSPFLLIKEIKSIIKDIKTIRNNTESNNNRGSLFGVILITIIIFLVGLFIVFIWNNYIFEYLIFAVPLCICWLWISAVINNRTKIALFINTIPILAFLGYIVYWIAMIE